MSFRARCSTSRWPSVSARRTSRSRTRHRRCVEALRGRHGIYVNSCFGLDATHGDIPNFFRLSAQVFLEKADFVRLGEAVLEELGRA